MKRRLHRIFTITAILLLFNTSLFAQIAGLTSVCEGQTESYTTSINAASYQWSVTGAKSFTPNGSTVTIEWEDAGTGSIALSAFDQDYLPAGSANLSVSIQGRPNPLIISSFATTCFDGQEPKDSCFTACNGKPIVYTAPFVAGANYSWQVVGDGSLTQISPNEVEVTWSSIGQYYIKLTVSNGAGCSNSFEKCVNVIESPTATIGWANSPFSSLYVAGQPVTVCKNGSFFLEDHSVGANGRRWDFGDGNSSDEMSISHSYSQSGTYQVILTASNDCFCLDSDTITVIVQDSEAPEIVCIGTVCAGDTVAYEAITDCREFGWRLLGSGPPVLNSSIPYDNKTPLIVWQDHPAYLEYYGAVCPNGCTANIIEKVPVVADSIPINGSTVVCVGERVTYSVEPIPGSDYFWTVDASLGSIIEDKGYAITVEIGGSGNIDLFYIHSILGCSGNASLAVSAAERLIFDMPREVCNSDISQLMVDHPIDWSVQNASGIELYTATDEDAVTIDWSFLIPGEYSLHLGKRTAYCNDLALPFTILPAPVVPDSIYGPTTICAATAYAYHVNPKSGYRIEWEVNGGTPETSTGNSVTVNWNSAGPYQIKAAYRQVDAPHCRSNFTVKTVQSILNATPAIVALDSACGGDTATLQLNFTADHVQWTVIPADGASIQSDRFSSEILVQYNAATTQSITIRADGEVCGTPFLLDHTVYVQSFPRPSIQFSNTSPCPHSPVQFSSNADHPTWLINGNSYSTASPILSFDSAQTVQTRVTANYVGPLGCKVERVNVLPLTVNAAPKALIAVLDTNATHCKDSLSPIRLLASLQGANIGSYVYEWSKDGAVLPGINGFGYLTPTWFPHGDYRVKITAPNGCISVSDPFQLDTCTQTDGCQNISVDPSVSVQIVLDSSSCSRFFVGAVNVTGGSLVDIRLTNTNIPVDSVGPYQLGFRLGSGEHSLRFEGSVNTASGTLCFVIVLTKDIPVQHDFSILKLACNNTGLARYQFVNTSTYATTPTPQFTWNFGNNAVVVNNGFNPVVEFTPGSHTITLSTPGSGCSYSQQLTVDVPTVAGFVSTAPACQQEPVYFTNASSGNIIEYRWELDGQVLYDEHPTVTFVEPNNIHSQQLFPTIKLFVLDTDGCTDTLSQTISIRGNQFSGSVQAGSTTTFCEGDSVQLRYMQATLTNLPITYTWSNHEDTRSTQVKQTGNYQLSITDNVGCRFVSNQVNVEVNAFPKPSIVGKPSFCADEKVKLSVLDHPSYTLNWTLNGNLTAISGEEFSMNLPSGSHSINTNAVNSFSGCSGSPSPFPITVLAALPKPVISTSQASPLCEGAPISLSANPAGGNFYWNTGQTGNSISPSLAGTYTVVQTDASGCTASQEIDIHPLPDFTNFMTGCYCLPAQPPVDLLGIPNMSAYQWKKDGINLPSPHGQQQNLTATTGKFSLIAVSDSGCVDSAGFIDITIGGCDPCQINLSNFTVQCTRIDGDSAFYDFTLEAGVNNSPSFYDLSANIRVGLQPAIVQSLQPVQISGNGNTLTGSFVLLDSIANGALCLVVTASNPAVNCSAEICTTLSPPVCSIAASFDSVFDDENCTLTLTSHSMVADACINLQEDSIRWEVTTQGNTYVKWGKEVTFNQFRNQEVTVCMTVNAHDFTGNIQCDETICEEIQLPDCSCQEACEDQYMSTAYFEELMEAEDSCLIRFTVEITDANGSPFDLAALFTNSGTVVNSFLVSASGGIQIYTVDFYPNETWRGGEACFEFFITTEEGGSCCIEFCIELPNCESMERKVSPNAWSSEKGNTAFEVYPNPAQQLLTIAWDTALNENLEIVLLDQNSQVVNREQRRVKGKILQMDVNNYAEGVYVLEIKRAENTTRKKVVILR